MADKTGIEWTDATWNPVRGCTKVSPGCDNCYAMRQARRMDHPGGAYEGLTRILNCRPQWNGKITLVPDLLSQPLRWTRPRRIFVNSMSDLFHPGVPDSFIDLVFSVMALSPQHTFQVLTKRPNRMHHYVQGLEDARSDGNILMKSPIAEAMREVAMMRGSPFPGNAPLELLIEGRWPLPNVWLGVSVENQAAADERIPDLLRTPAAVRWLSAEPLLGPVDLERVQWPGKHKVDVLRRGAWDLPGWVGGFTNHSDMNGVDWVVVGGESGPGSRPMHPAWVRVLRDQCCESGVAFLFKQWGDWVELAAAPDSEGDVRHIVSPANVPGADFAMRRVGKREAGRLLDGEAWDQYPG